MSLRREPILLQLLLLGATLLTTSIVGAVFAFNFRHDLPPVRLDRDAMLFVQVLREPARWAQGLPFSLTLIGILLAHELGHYFTCLRHRVSASLPYFLPFPSLIGTLGAFIKVRSPIYRRKVLFDVGVSGPVAGMVVLMPALFAGLLLSRVSPGAGAKGDLVFGNPLLLQIMAGLTHPGVSLNDIYLHPVARASVVGLFATALNLLPIGQLDGGHVLYAWLGDRFRWVSGLWLILLVPLGFLYWPWWALAALLLLFGLRHPMPIFDPETLGPKRKALALVALLIFLVSFTPAPVVSGK